MCLLGNIGDRHIQTLTQGSHLPAYRNLQSLYLERVIHQRITGFVVLGVWCLWYIHACLI